MLDIFGLDANTSFVQVFSALSTASGAKNFHEWYRPRGCRFVFLFGTGGGGGGGGGLANVAGTARGGGSGGGSGAICGALYFASSLPECLFIAPGTGGAGGADSSAGGGGSGTYVMVRPDPSFAAAFTVLFANGGSNGSAGTIGAVGGGAAGVQQNLSSLPLVAQALANFPTATTVGYFGTGGGAGGNGGAQSNGSSQNAFAASFMHGGAGGGSVSAGNLAGNGGTIVGVAETLLPLTVLGGTAGGVLDGVHGIGSLTPFFATGGGGGAGNPAGTGGKGGDGGVGGGGGAGGGAGTTGGAGGRGGDGIVAVICW